MGKKRYSEEELNAFENNQQDNSFEDVIYLANSKRERPQEEPEQTVVTEYERVGAGRPKLQRKVERGKPMNVYFDPNTHQLLKSMKYHHDFEMKDIPYVLTREFFKKYEVDGKLSAEGISYLQRLLAEVN